MIVLNKFNSNLFCSRSDAQRAAKQKEAKERELEAHAFSADRIEEGGFPVSMVSILLYIHLGQGSETRIDRRATLQRKNSPRAAV
jgi:hypothetical protein